MAESLPGVLRQDHSPEPLRCTFARGSQGGFPGHHPTHLSGQRHLPGHLLVHLAEHIPARNPGPVLRSSKQVYSSLPYMRVLHLFCLGLAESSLLPAGLIYSKLSVATGYTYIYIYIYTYGSVRLTPLDHRARQKNSEKNPARTESGRQIQNISEIYIVIPNLERCGVCFVFVWCSFFFRLFFYLFLCLFLEAFGSRGWEVVECGFT